MQLQTLGGLALQGSSFRRPKPLLLLTYLALEGAKDRHHLAELFWPDAAEPPLWGGRDWPPEAYNPDTGYVYISANENLCHEMTGQDVEYEEGDF